jgi:hypothetical protein
MADETTDDDVKQILHDIYPDPKQEVMDRFLETLRLAAAEQTHGPMPGQNIPQMRKSPRDIKPKLD